MWCPSVSLSVWTNAWLAGHAAPDDVLDALNAWAPTHSVTAYDAVAAGRTGLPWPDVDAAGAMSLLQTVRTAAGLNPGMLTGALKVIDVALPVPGDVRGLPAGTQFQRDALDAGEAVLIRAPDGEAIGLVPVFELGDEDESDIPEIPVHAPDRALRVLATAAHVDAIIAVSAGPAPIAMLSVSEERIADDAMRPLAMIVRAARTAAVSAILQSAWH